MIYRFRPGFEASATSLVLQRGGMIPSNRAVLQLDAAMWGQGEMSRKGPAHEAVLRDTWHFAREVIDARRQADDVAFAQSRHQLERALARYWAERARDEQARQDSVPPFQAIDAGDRW